MLATHRALKPRATQPDWSQRWVALGAIGLALATAATATVGAFAAIRSDEANRRSDAANREQLQIAERGQINDRFTTATDQLASEKLESRLGGIYALEQIMHDASTYYEDPIIEILSAYIRTHAPKTNTANAQSPAIDVQAALGALGRRPNAQSHRPPQLAHTNLAGTQLAGANLIGADLTGTDLTKAYLAGTQLAGANLTKANLAGANLAGANLIRADLREADLTEAYLAGADLTEAYLAGANLRETNLAGADLTGAVIPQPSTSPAGQGR